MYKTLLPTLLAAVLLAACASEPAPVAELPVEVLPPDSQPADDEVLQPAIEPGDPGARPATSGLADDTSIPLEGPENAPETYINGDYVFSIILPDGWQVTAEDANSVTFASGDVRLVLGFRAANEDIDIWGRSGLPAGELVEGPALVLDAGEAPGTMLVYEGEPRMMYWGDPSVPLAIGPLEMLPVLEANAGMAYETVVLTPDQQAQAADLIRAIEYEGPR